MGEKEQFLEWGVCLTKVELPRYPHILIGSSPGKCTTSKLRQPGCLKGALGREDASREFLDLATHTSLPKLALGKITVVGNNRQIMLDAPGSTAHDWTWIGATLNRPTRPHS